MKTCTHCQASALQTVNEMVQEEVAGLVFRKRIPVLRCASCGEVFYGPELGDFEQEVASALAHEGPLSGDAFRYMRKALGLRATDLAPLLGVHAVTISRWETGQDTVNRAAFIALGDMVLDAAAGKTTTRDRLGRLAEPAVSREVML